MNDAENAQLIFESLVDIVIQRKELSEVENLLRNQLQKHLEVMPLSTTYEGYITYLAKNTPSRRVNYSRLEKHDEQYQWLLTNKIITVIEPKTLQRLVVTKPKEKPHFD